MTYIYNGNFMKQLLIDPVILSAVTLTHPFVMVQRPPLWPQSSGLNASPVKTLLSELPFLCLLTAARWRHKTSLSLRHIYFLTMRFSCKVVCHLICLNLLMSQQNVQQWVDKSAVAILNTNIVLIIASHLFVNNEIFLQSHLPFDLFKRVDVKGECIAMLCMWINIVWLLTAYEHGCTVVLHLSMMLFSKFNSQCC